MPSEPAIGGRKLKKRKRALKHRTGHGISSKHLDSEIPVKPRPLAYEYLPHKLFTQNEVKITSKNVAVPSDLIFNIDSVAGQGAYGSVYKAVNMQTGSIVALKELRALEKPEAGINQVIVREIQILSSLEHQNIAQLDEIVRLDRRIYMAFEYVENDLAGLLKTESVRFTLPMVRSFIRQLTQALDYIHQRNIIHRDIKSANILISQNGVVKLADFGMARYLPVDHRESMTNRVVTVCYRPPELILGAVRYSQSVDMWCLGCLVFELLQRKPLFNTTNEVLQYEAIVGFLGSPTDTTWPGLFKLPWYPMLCQIRCDEPTAERAFASLPEELGRVARQLLRWDPALRAAAQTLLANELREEAIWPERVDILFSGERHFMNPRPQEVGSI